MARVLRLGIRQGTMDGACNRVDHVCENMQKRLGLRWIVGAYSFAIQIGGGFDTIGTLVSHRGHHIRRIQNDSFYFVSPVPQCSFGGLQG